MKYAKGRAVAVGLLSIVTSFVLTACMIDYEPVDSTNDLPLPQAVITNSTAVDAARRFLGEDTQFDAFVALHGASTVTRWGEAGLPIHMHSVREGLLSALFGIAEAKGLIRLDETMASLGIDEPVCR